MWQQVERVFHEAAELEPTVRPQFLDQACEGDEELRREVESLLARADKDGLLAKSLLDAALPMVSQIRASTWRLSPGMRLGPYEITAAIGAGGMAEVYKARDTKLHRDVALKVLPETFRRDRERIARFHREAQLLASLNHPRIAAIYGIEEHDELCGLALEFVDGETLAERVALGPLPLDEALQFARQIAEALGAAHAKGVVHRDLKTRNVIVTPEGQVKVLDFGLAKQIHETASVATDLTDSATIIGTVPYMSPEQLRNSAVDSRTDVWSLGVMLFEMVTGTLPFRARTNAELTSIILRDPPPRLPEEVPAELKAVILRCLEKDSARRYRHAGELLEALHAIHGGRRVNQERTWKRAPRIAVAASVLALSVLGIVQWRRPDPLKTTPTIRTLVVLPLENLTGDPNQEYFVDGMTEALSGTFSQIGNATVRSNTSAMRYKQTTKNAPQIAQELGGLDWIVEGSVHLSGNRVRVVISLIEAATDRQLKTAEFQQDVGNIFDLYSEIARSAATEFNLAISGTQDSRLTRQYKPDPEAYDAYMKGRDYYRQWGKVNVLPTAIRYFEESIAKDSKFAQAHAGLALALLNITPPQTDNRTRARSAALRAVDLDSNLSEAHTALAISQMDEWNWSGSEASFKRAIELDRNSAVAHQFYASLLRQTMRFEDAFKEAKLAEDLDPLSLSAKTMVGWVLFNQHRYDEALRLWDAVLALDPNYGLAIYNKGLVYGVRGLGEETIDAALLAKTRTPGAGPVWLEGVGYALVGKRKEAEDILRKVPVPGQVAVLHYVLGNHDKALDILEKAVADRHPAIVNVTSEPWLDGLRGHPRFQALRAKMSLQ
jgi:serine/threonine-protein kinase